MSTDYPSKLCNFLQGLTQLELIIHVTSLNDHVWSLTTGDLSALQLGDLILNIVSEQK